MADVDIEILDGGLGLIPSSGDDLCAVIGTCSLGTPGSIVATRDPAALLASRGRGPGVECAANMIKLTGKPVLFLRAATTTAGAVDGKGGTPINIVSSTNATPIVVTTAAHGKVDGDVVTIAAHLVNTAANGTWVIDVISPTTFSLRGSVGVGIGVATGTVTPEGVNVRFTGTNPGTSTPTLSGTPLDSARFRWQWIKGGTRGAAGATFRYSGDGGQTYSPELQIGTAVSYEIPNTGVTVNFSAGSWIAGDEYRFTTTEPLWGDSDVVDCIRALGASVQKFRLIQLAGALDASSAVTFDVELEALANDYRYIGLLGHARDFAAADTDEAGWISSLTNDFSSFATTRVSVCAGHYNVTSAITGWKGRRSLGYVAGARLMARPIHEHAGRVRTGSLKGIEIPSEEATTLLALDDLIYHDERITQGLTAARFFAAKTRIGRTGLFVDQPKMMSQPTSDYQLWPHRSVMDKACDTAYEVLVDVVNDDLDVDATGRIAAKDARAIDSKMKSANRVKLSAPGHVSDVTSNVLRDDNFLTSKTVRAEVRITPKGYAETVSATIGYTNPSLETA